MVKLIFLSWCLITFSIARAAQLNCRGFYFHLNASAENRIAINPPEDLYTDPDKVVQFISQPVAYTNVTGTYKIFGQLCAPTKKAALPKLQVLVHGNTYNHTYWSALQNPDSETFAERSWVRYAAEQGYHTLALDNLGSGLSSHPNPATVVQDPLDTELIHKIIQKFRRFPTVIYVGHSWGSGLGVHLAASHPDDFDGMILTGIAQVRGNPSVGSLYNRWDSLPGHVGYLASANKTARREYFFYGDYDLVEDDWNGQGTISTGEFLTGTEYLSHIPKTFAKPVFVMVGNEDVIFCSEKGVQPANCSNGDEVPRVKEFFPAVPASKFGYFIQPNSGHVLGLQHTAALGFAKAFEWLADMNL
ncbi:alpha/beta-hydrolase [Tothia fuscella]|uniref:Alpha/beta-hydrolase n=1 Tax=Tothia fuscella TaxID=1048955 RepID=A0A9P4NHX8_9PEZI|nr:alpha/beta-hydrolase [Tothia fuscella]